MVLAKGLSVMIQLKKLLSFMVFIPVLILSSCALKTEPPFIATNKLILAEQHPSTHFDQEVMIVRISQILLVGKMSKEERASLHFERGVLYDSLGLWALARYDFTQALALQPKMTAVYNYLGLYLLLDEDYDGALDAFSAVLELEPSYEYAYLNRGLNFYYTERYSVAQQDLIKFYENDKSDPYRALWLYLNESELKPEEAKQNLVQRANALSSDYWGTNIVQYYLGNTTLEELQQKAKHFAEQNSPKYAEILTETYFYIAKHKLNAGQIDEAATLFKLAMANKVYNFVEYRFALFELSKLERYQAEQAAVPNVK